MYVSLVYLSTNMLVLGTNQIFTLLYISIGLPHSKHCSTKLLLRVGLIHATYVSMQYAWAPPTLNRSSLLQWLNAEIILKYVHRNSIYTWPYHVCTKITKGQYSHPLTFDNMHNVRFCTLCYYTSRSNNTGLARVTMKRDQVATISQEPMSLTSEWPIGMKPWWKNWNTFCMERNKGCEQSPELYLCTWAPPILIMSALNKS